MMNQPKKNFLNEYKDFLSSKNEIHNDIKYLKNFKKYGNFLIKHYEDSPINQITNNRTSKTQKL